MKIEIELREDDVVDAYIIERVQTVTRFCGFSESALFKALFLGECVSLGARDREAFLKALLHS